MSRFVRVRTSDLITAVWIPFPKEWNMKPIAWFPGGVLDLEGWVRKPASISSYLERCWRDLAKGRWEAKNHGLGDAVAMRPASDDEEEVLKSSKERKRKRESPVNPPKPKKSVDQRSKVDTAALSPETAQRLRDQEEEEDNDYLLVAHKRKNAGASKSVEPVKVVIAHSRVEKISDGRLEDGPDPDASFIFDEARRLFKQAVVLHKKAFSKSQTDLARCEAEHKKVSKERDDLKALYVKKEMEINGLRVELAQACQGRVKYVEKEADLVAQLREELKMKEAETLGVKEESLARDCKIGELKAKSAAELAKARSDIEAIISSYRADAEAANARAKEFSSAAEVKLSSALDHARRQSRRVTLGEVHARGFILSADIERARILKEEVAALLSDEDDSASGSKSGGDEDGVLEDEALEDATAEDVTPK
ncbi:PREDICTED: uncharacterized protein LOC109232614 [Nicotiana attenuata]|uniref:uncharacterized protein LOC109232614 n=1 Tax=Nicotiana attenuata TaxID=49451 RepID=UPI00090589C1|nr:PREDICTED: uncharacterized protein LOC109232614 [Nicotiana attenuata]